MKKIIFFSTESVEGKQLREKLEVLFSQQSTEFVTVSHNELHQLYLEYKSKGQQVTPQQVASHVFLSSLFEFDWIIVDLTREDGVQTNYSLIGELPKTVSYITIVSRNYIPINLYSYEKGGYPSYTKGTMTNDEIVKYIEGHFTPEVHFPGLKNPEYKFANIYKNGEIGAQYNEFLKEQIDYIKHKDPKKLSIFISYRSRYENRNALVFPQSYRYSVAELAEILNGRKKELLDFSNEMPANKQIAAQYLSEGELVYSKELLSKFRAWQLLAFIDRYYIYNCDEFWIYSSKDYWSSWWSRGEVIAYINSLLSQKMNNKVENRILRIYDPEQNKVVASYKMEEILNFVNFDQSSFSKKYARYFTNVNIDTMGPESTKALKNMKKIPDATEMAIQQLLLTDDSMLESMRMNFEMIRNMDEYDFNQLMETDDPQIQPMVSMFKMVRTWSENDISVYLKNWNEMSEKIKKFNKEMPNATMQDLHKYVINSQFGSLLKQSDNDIVDTITGKEFYDDYLSHEIFSDEFENELYVIEPSEENVAFPLNFDDNLLNSFFNINDTPDSKNPYLLKEQNGAIIENGKRKTIRNEKPRYVFVPRHAGGLIDWSNNMDCLDELPVRIVNS
jgi:hypothetical protein